MHKEPSNDKTLNTSTLRFDPQDYIQYLDGLEITEQEAEALLTTLWQIMVQCVDLGFQIDPGPDTSPPISTANKSATLGHTKAQRPKTQTKGDLHP